MSRSVKRVRRSSLLDPHSESFRQFSDVLIAGIFVFFAGLLVVTWFAAVAAATAALRESRASGDALRVSALWAELVRRLRTRWVSHLAAPAAVLALLALDALVLPFAVGDVTVALVIIAGTATAAMTVGLVYALVERPGMAGRAVWREAAHTLSTAPGAVAMLALAVLASGAIIAIAPLLVIVMFGPLSFAGAAVGLRLDAHATQR